MNRRYYIPGPGGYRAGPYTELDIMDLLETGELTREMEAVEEPGGMRFLIGDAFRQVVLPTPPPRPANTPPPAVEPEPRSWQPRPFPREAEPSPAPIAPAPAPQKPEKLAWIGHAAVLNYWRSGLAAAAVWCAGSLGSDHWPPALAAGILGAALILLVAALRRHSRCYLVTTRRAEVQSGLVAKSTREIRLRDIRAIHVEKSGVTGLLGIGNVVFSSEAGPGEDVRFLRISGASRVRDLVRKLQDRAGI